MSKLTSFNELPGTTGRVAQEHPQAWDALENLDTPRNDVDPLDARTQPKA